MYIENQSNTGKTILLIDDNEIDLFINEKVILARKSGAKILKEQSAKRAIEVFINAKTKKSIPDIIFIDLNMPMMSGFEFLEIFETLPLQLTSECRIFMLSTSTQEVDIKRAERYRSVVKFLNKPLDLREVAEV